jgi:hypothetical protein
MLRSIDLFTGSICTSKFSWIIRIWTRKSGTKDLPERDIGGNLGATQTFERDSYGTIKRVDSPQNYI